jgi:hypothetical protein
MVFVKVIHKLRPLDAVVKVYRTEGVIVASELIRHQRMQVTDGFDVVNDQISLIMHRVEVKQGGKRFRIRGGFHVTEKGGPRMRVNSHQTHRMTVRRGGATNRNIDDITAQDGMFQSID